MAHGDDIHIEERGDNEVTFWGAIKTAPEGARSYNPAFDVTPAQYISAITTEFGVVTPGTGPQLTDILQQS